ncbi:hypothetical protein JW921_09675 [Candidatus Fermentibacterales bacterium]|nr:hypothetical protein [Candidatus Fermentibacterales bacterium]
MSSESSQEHAVAESSVFAITEDFFLKDRQGRTFKNVVEGDQPRFRQLLEFFSDEARQVRMEDAERHFNLPALAGVVRELEDTSPFREWFSDLEQRASCRLRQAIGVIVRIIMEQRGWRKTNRTRSMGQTNLRTPSDGELARHNTAGLSWWFTKAARFEKPGQQPFRKPSKFMPNTMMTVARQSRRSVRQ